MKPIVELLHKRDSTVYKVAPDVTVFDGLKLLSDYGVGAMLVMDGETLVGVLSERDYTRKVALQGKNSRETRVAEIMTRDVITTTEDTPIEEAAQHMLEHKIGCLPVMRDGKLVGIITESDIFRTFMELFSARQKGLRITLEVPDREGELATVAQAIADQGGYIAACGTFMAEDPTKWGLVFKVRNVDREILLDTLSKIEGQAILDVREV